jgi:phage terminase large subunit-like protein
LILLEQELEAKQENEKCEFYIPNGRIEYALDLFCKEPITCISAANAVGKTTFLVNVACNLIFGPQNKWFEKDLIKNWPKDWEKRIRIVSEPSQVKESGPIPSEIRKWWPKGQYTEFKGGYQYVSEYRANGWIMEVLTYEQDRKQHEGANLGCVLFNEPPPKSLWTPNISRLRGKGRALVAMTPLTEAGWFFDEVAPTIEVVYADVESACKEHGTRGHLDHNQIDSMISMYDAEEREARIDGKAMYLKGLIFKDFNPNVHILKQPVQAQHNQTLYHVVDPHTDKPFAMIWATVDPRGVVTIVDEWPNVDFYKWKNCNLSIPDYKNIFADKENGVYVTKRIIDRHFAEVTHLSGMTRKTLRDEFMDAGIDFFPSYQAAEEVDTGISKVREYLRFNSNRPIDSYNTPKLFINPHCFNTIKSLTRWSRDAKTGKVTDEFKDFCDVVRYLVMSNPEVDEPIPRYAPRKLWGN